MDAEIHSSEKNNTWELASRPLGEKPIGVKWLYKRKYKIDGRVDRSKARLAIKGYKHKLGIDYFEVVARVDRMDTIRLILAFACQNRWKTRQMDVKQAYLNGVSKRESMWSNHKVLSGKGIKIKFLN